MLHRTNRECTLGKVAGISALALAQSLEADYADRMATGRTGGNSGSLRLAHDHKSGAIEVFDKVRCRDLCGYTGYLGLCSAAAELQAEGKGDQSKADLKDAGEKVKDAFKH